MPGTDAVLALKVPRLGNCLSLSRARRLVTLMERVSHISFCIMVKVFSSANKSLNFTSYSVYHLLSLLSQRSHEATTKTPHLHPLTFTPSSHQIPPNIQGEMFCTRNLDSTYSTLNPSLLPHVGGHCHFGVHMSKW